MGVSNAKRPAPEGPTGDQSIESQRGALGGTFEKEFEDVLFDKTCKPILTATSAAPTGDVVHVYAVDRLGRDAIDVQSTVKRLLDAGVTIDIHGIGPLVGETAGLILAVFAQLAQMERAKITARTEAGRVAARASIAATGLTHKGKTSLGRPQAQDGAAVVAWRKANSASIKQTADHFSISTATVKRYQTGA